MDHVDVVVVGAGISGIGAGYHLQANCPDRSYVILEGRGVMFDPEVTDAFQTMLKNGN